MIDIHFSINPVIDESTAGDIVRIYESIGWGSNYDVRQTAEAWNATSYRILCLQGGSVVGALRGFSDQMYISWLAEIVVLKAHQRHGIGKRLLAEFIDSYKTTTIYAEALTGTASVEFLSLHGIKVKPNLVACAYSALGRRTA